MCACETADLPGHSVPITSTCTTKLERLDEIRTCGKSNLENKFLDTVSQLLEELIIFSRNWSIEFLEKLRYT